MTNIDTRKGGKQPLLVTSMDKRIKAHCCHILKIKYLGDHSCFSLNDNALLGEDTYGNAQGQSLLFAPSPSQKWMLV